MIIGITIVIITFFMHYLVEDGPTFWENIETYLQLLFVVNVSHIERYILIWKVQNHPIKSCKGCFSNEWVDCLSHIWYFRRIIYSVKVCLPKLGPLTLEFIILFPIFIPLIFKLVDVAQFNFCFWFFRSHSDFELVLKYLLILVFPKKSKENVFQFYWFFLSKSMYVLRIFVNCEIINFSET